MSRTGIQSIAEITKELNLRNGLSKSRVKKPFYNYFKHLAAAERDVDRVRELLKNNKINVNAKDADGKTALHHGILIFNKTL